MAVHKAAGNARTNRPPIVLLDLGPCSFDELAVFHSCRACGFASAAIETLVNMPHKGVAQRQPPFIDQDHLPNSSARRIRLQSPQPVRGAMVETQAAVNAMQIVHVLRKIGTAEPALAAGRSLGFNGNWGGLRHLAQMPPRNRPGERILFGSNTCFKRSAISRSAHAGGHMSSVFFISRGQRSIIGAAPLVTQRSIISREHLSNSGKTFGTAGGKNAK